jgi:hypothetical protein
MAAAEWFVNLFSGYAALGVLFAIVFVTAGVTRLDPVAKGSSIGFKLIIFPGVAALWPVLLLQWTRKGRRI